MTPVLVILIVLVVAALALAVGYLLALSRSAAGLAAVRSALQDSELARAGLQGDLGRAERQLQDQKAQRQEDLQTLAKLQLLSTTLDALNNRVIEAEKGRAAADQQLRTMLRSQSELTQAATTEVQREARKLGKALTRTSVRGQWGESELRRLVEAAGMLERVHFDTQTTLVTLDASKRPDMIIHLAGGRDIVVDAKVPLDALLEDLGDDTDTYSHEVLRRHAAALKAHVDTLAGRRYADALADAPELVVMYLPAESLLSLALSADAGLLDHAFGKGVAIATPTTMLALLRTVGHGWRQEAVAQHAREIHAVGAELHKRLLTMSKHLAKVGKSLDDAVKAFNETVGSYETRVLVSARRLESMEVVGEPIPEIRQLETSSRSTTVAPIDLTDDPPVRAVSG